MIFASYCHFKHYVTLTGEFKVRIRIRTVIDSFIDVSLWLGIRFILEMVDTFWACVFDSSGGVLKVDIHAEVEAFAKYGQVYGGREISSSIDGIIDTNF